MCVSEALAEIIISGRPSIPHSSSSQVTAFRHQDAENQFLKFQVPVIKHSTKTATKGQVTVRDAIPCGKSKDQQVCNGS